MLQVKREKLLLQRQKNCTERVDNENEVQLHRRKEIQPAQTVFVCMSDTLSGTRLKRPAASVRCPHLKLSWSLFRPRNSRADK